LPPVIGWSMQWPTRKKWKCASSPTIAIAVRSTRLRHRS